MGKKNSDFLGAERLIQVSNNGPKGPGQPLAWHQLQEITVVWPANINMQVLMDRFKPSLFVIHSYTWMYIVYIVYYIYFILYYI